MKSLLWSVVCVLLSVAPLSAQVVCTDPITVDDASIKALPTTPVTLATGPSDRVLVPVLVTLRAHLVAPYGNIVAHGPWFGRALEKLGKSQIRDGYSS